MVEKFKFVELMKLAIYIVCFLASFSLFAQKEKVYLIEGNLAYNNEEYVKADSLYSKAIEIQQDYRLAQYNKALALYKMGEFVKSAELFDLIIEAPEDSLSSWSNFNQGNCFLKVWFLEDTMLETVSQEIQDSEINKDDDIEVKMDKYLRKDSLIQLQKELIISKEKHLNLSLEKFKRALILNPLDEEARYNLVYTLKLFPIIEEEEKKQKQKEQQKQKQKEQEKPSDFEVETYKRVLDLISKHDFKGAYFELSNGINQEPKLQKHNQLLQKLEIITNILDK